MHETIIDLIECSSQPVTFINHYDMSIASTHYYHTWLGFASTLGKDNTSPKPDTESTANTIFENPMYSESNTNVDLEKITSNTTNSNIIFENPVYSEINTSVDLEMNGSITTDNDVSHNVYEEIMPPNSSTMLPDSEIQTETQECYITLEECYEK